MFTITHDDNPVYETVAIYSCENGIIGNNTRMCECSGQWSAEPDCREGIGFSVNLLLNVNLINVIRFLRRQYCIT